MVIKPRLKGSLALTAHPAGCEEFVKRQIDYVKSQGKSLVTPIVFTDGRKVELLQENVAVKAGDENIIKL